MKKKWKKPELIVLVRSTPAENVLRACKVKDLGGPPSQGEQLCTSEQTGVKCLDHGVS